MAAISLGKGREKNFAEVALVDNSVHQHQSAIPKGWHNLTRESPSGSCSEESRHVQSKMAPGTGP
jgi:hypothetical protein